MTDCDTGLRSLRVIVMRFVLCTFVVLVLPACGRAARPGGEGPLAGLRAVEEAAGPLPERAMAAVITAAYEGLFPAARDGSRFVTATDHELDLLYQASYLAAFYSLAPRHVRVMVVVRAILAARGRTSASDDEKLYQSFVHARMLVEAAAFARQHPAVAHEPLPALHEAAALVPGAPTAWRIHPEQRVMVRESVDVHAAAQVVIVSHPRCHFSRAASRALRGDPVLAEVLRRHATYLAPQDERLYVDDLQRWNRAHPGEEVVVTAQRDEWPMIDSWTTPTFYVLAHGVVTAKVEGWPRGGRRAELVAALRQVGLLP